MVGFCWEGGRGWSDSLVCVCVSHMSAYGLTGSEYMALMFSLNSIVAVTKMDSVADSDFPLVRKSLTYDRRESNY